MFNNRLSRPGHRERSRALLLSSARAPSHVTASGAAFSCHREQSRFLMSPPAAPLSHVTASETAFSFHRARSRVLLSSRAKPFSHVTASDAKQSHRAGETACRGHVRAAPRFSQCQPRSYTVTTATYASRNGIALTSRRQSMVTRRQASRFVVSPPRFTVTTFRIVTISFRYYSAAMPLRARNSGNASFALAPRITLMP
jgi:hypothetical protein